MSAIPPPVTDFTTVRKLTRQVQALREGGHTQRLHTVPHLGDASVATHSWNMAVMYLQLCPEPKLNVVKHILEHDVAERWIGDTPAPAKYAINPELGRACHAAEALVEAALDIESDLPKEDQRWVKGLDLFELMLYCEDQLAIGNRNVELTGENCRVILREHWVPQLIKDMATHYVWSRTCDIVEGEVMRGLDQGQR